MNGRWLRVGVLLALSAMILIRAAPAIATYTYSNPDTGLTTIGTSYDFEANNATSSFNVYVAYAPGFAYNYNSQTPTVANILAFHLDSAKDAYGGKLQNYTVYMWYSNRIYSTQAPLYNTILLFASHPWGILYTGGTSTYSNMHEVSFSVSFGVKKLKFKGGAIIGESHTVSVPLSVDVEPYWMNSQNIYTANQITQFEKKLIKGKSGFYIYPGNSNNWKLRYIGKITVTKNKGDMPTSFKLAAILAVGNKQASYVDNTLHDGPVLIVLVVADYYSGHPFYEFWESDHKAVLEDLFILGDGGQKYGYDTPLWYYSVSW